MKRIINFFIILITLLINQGYAQSIDATLLEINYHGDSDPNQFLADQNGFYFVAKDLAVNGIYGEELWYSDGTEQGTKLVKDIYPGPASSSPALLGINNNILFFVAKNAGTGVELYRSDGTVSGTYMIKEIVPGDNDFNNAPAHLVGFGNKVYFSANDNVNGNELWTSDGTAAGTFMVKNINTVAGADGSPKDLFVFNNQLFFIANDGSLGQELWKSDGTESGTNLLKDFNTFGNGMNEGNEFLVLNNAFYFFADDFTFGFELWKSDGTATGTTMVKDINFERPSSATKLRGNILNGKIIFEANNGINGTELWQTDGTTAGTNMIKDINGTDFSSLLFQTPYQILNNELYFVASNITEGHELWKTNGTSSGTTMVIDTEIGITGIIIDKMHVNITSNKLMFYATPQNSNDRKLWISDGSKIGTIELFSEEDGLITGFNGDFININNRTIFTGSNVRYGEELWITDGTNNGTGLFKDLSQTFSSNPAQFTEFNGNLMFSANGFLTGKQLFSSNGTIAGTNLVKNIKEGINTIDPDIEMITNNGTLFFVGNDGVNGNELWKSDGTTLGTELIKDIFPGTQSGLFLYNDDQPFVLIDGILYFYADDGVNGFELWNSNGTSAGTKMVKDIKANGSSYARNFVTLNGKIYFIAEDNTGSGLWTTNGTATGTTKITNLTNLSSLYAVNNKLLMIAETTASSGDGRDLWVSDGTSAGTNLLMTFGDEAGSKISYLTTLNQALYFVAKHPSNGSESVYKSDGTMSGTMLLFDGDTHPIANLVIDDILTCGNYVYFSLEPSLDTDKELWRTNGTVTGTIKVAGDDTTDFSSIRALSCFENNLLYLAEDPAQSLWVMNGNLSQPKQVNVNIINGQNFIGSSTIHGFGKAGAELFLDGENNQNGRELYVSTPNFNTLSIDEFGNEVGEDIRLVKLYPNPASSRVHLKSVNNTIIESIELFDYTGKRLMRKLNNDVSNEFVVDIGLIAKGIYLVKTNLTDGVNVSTKLIIH